MMNKRVWPFLVLAIGVFVLIGAKGWGNKGLDNDERYARVLTTVGGLLEQAHYSPKKLDDNFSREVFKEYLHSLDPERNIFLQSDIDQLRPFETQIDNEIRTGKADFVKAVHSILSKRLPETADIYKQVLAKPFDYTIKESLQTDKEDKPFAATLAERDDNWRKRLKWMALERYASGLETREKNRDSANFTIKADSTIERESRESVSKIWNRTYEKLESKYTLDDLFNMYVNTIAETFDPHTQFFPPVEKRAFDEAMSGEFFGIGAQLQDKDGEITIVSLITGGPAFKNGQIKVNDVILKVGQGALEPVDITGFEVTDAVKLIRGAEGSEVRLTMKKPDGTIHEISLIRDRIVQDETFARSTLLNRENGGKTGYIWLPEFYANFEDPNGARSARDVAAEITKLKEQNIDGLIIDLRFNGGGSLQDVIQMVGLFIEDGPIVQVKGRDGEPSIYQDKDKSILYDGPLVVMINEFSASASEIFAAAIQDYGRGIIVGTPSFGKGTVQRQIGLDNRFSGYFGNNDSDLGALKLTLQKFYRINGGSTQQQGVVPDIILPDKLEFFESREKNNPNSLSYDVINKVAYKAWPGSLNVDAVISQYKSGENSLDTFDIIRNNSRKLSNINKDEISLYLPDFQANRRTINATARQTDSLETLTAPMAVKFVTKDQERINDMDKEKRDRYMAWLKTLSTDRYLYESANILDAMVTLDKGTASN